MKKTGALLLVGLGAVALYFFSKVKASQVLKVYFDSLQIGKIKGLKLPDIFAKFRIVNPSNTALSVTAIAGDINVNGSQFADVQQTEKLEIPPNKEVFYSVKIRVNGIQAVYTIISLLRKKQKIKVDFNGTVNSTGILIPIEQTIYQS
jgi:LEA14-like dessication related protein